MAANDHLNRSQFPFMSMDHILQLRSAEAEPDYDEHTVEDVLPYKQEDIDSDVGGEFSRLRQSMSTRGQTVPINIANGVLGNGHHRVAMAQELGWPGMHYSANAEDTEDTQYNHA